MNPQVIECPVVKPFVQAVKKKKFFSILSKNKYKIVYREMYRLIRHWSYFDEKLGIRCNIRAGYVFDGASIPRIANMVGIRRGGVILAAALPHDRIYELKGRMPLGEWSRIVNGKWTDGARITRKEGDKMLKNIALLVGYGNARASTMYAAVRTPVGYYHWRS